MFRIKACLIVLAMNLAIDASAATKAITFGKLWDGRRVIPNAVVIVEGDRITNVTSNGRIPPGAQVIDMSRCTGMPGMIDSHTHITYYWDHAPGTTPRDRLAKPRHVAVTVVLAQANGMTALTQGATPRRDRDP